MDSPIIYNEHGLLHGTVDTGPEGCMSEWHEGCLISHYREIGLGWSIRVVKMWDSYYYSYKHIDYEKKQLREEIYGYKYNGAHNVKAGDIVFCAYKERPTFRVVEASERMITDMADNILFPLRIICKKVLLSDVSAMLDADDVEGVHELLDIQKPVLEIRDDYYMPVPVEKSYECVDSDED